ncbi:MAG: hypothetical protein RMK20_02615, partial [Verrucomicrobiales bacterium]|nr:hypothetical protein [Verrucomicrobiales bacterium]
MPAESPQLKSRIGRLVGSRNINPAQARGHRARAWKPVLPLEAMETGKSGNSLKPGSQLAISMRIAASRILAPLL